MEPEVVIPYGNARSSLHLRCGDTLTMCGRDSKGWSRADTTYNEAINSAYTCKQCVKAATR